MVKEVDELNHAIIKLFIKRNKSNESIIIKLLFILKHHLLDEF